MLGMWLFFWDAADWTIPPAPSTEGIEFTVDAQLMGFSVPDSRMHYTIGDSQLHFTIDEEDE